MRKSHAPTAESRAEVKALAAVGVREDEISKYVGISPHTLRKHYRDELDKAHIQATANVARSLYKQATEGGNVVAAIFWMKARAGWRDKPEIADLGKKEIQQKNAEQLSEGRFSPGRKPRLVVNNR